MDGLGFALILIAGSADGGGSQESSSTSVGFSHHFKDRSYQRNWFPPWKQLNFPAELDSALQSQKSLYPQSLIQPTGYQSTKYQPTSSTHDGANWVWEEMNLQTANFKQIDFSSIFQSALQSNCTSLSCRVVSFVVAAFLLNSSTSPFTTTHKPLQWIQIMRWRRCNENILILLIWWWILLLPSVRPSLFIERYWWPVHSTSNDMEYTYIKDHPITHQPTTH